MSWNREFEAVWFLLLGIVCLVQVSHLGCEQGAGPHAAPATEVLL